MSPGNSLLWLVFSTVEGETSSSTRLRTGVENETEDNPENVLLLLLLSKNPCLVTPQLTSPVEEATSTVQEKRL